MALRPISRLVFDKGGEWEDAIVSPEGGGSLGLAEGEDAG
jgi:hypothetical protein